MKNKKIEFIIFAVVIFIVGIFIWKKSTHKSRNEIVEEIYQEKAEQFYENHESFEKIVTYVNDFDFRSITEDNESGAEIIIDGISFKLLDSKKWENSYTLNLYSKRTLFLQMLEEDEKTSVVNVIGEGRSMIIYYDKNNYKVNCINFTIYDTRLKFAEANLTWHTSDYELIADWVYPLNENWTIAFMGWDIKY